MGNNCFKANEQRDTIVTSKKQINNPTVDLRQRNQIRSLSQ